jgi:hypothetical protein
MDHIFPNRPMSLWEVISGFREHPAALSSVLSSPAWREKYWEHFCQFPQLVENQDRTILDEPIPLELTRQLCSACGKELYLIAQEGSLLSYKPTPTTTFQTLSLLEVHERYGPAVIEEVLERSVAKVA